MPTLKTLFLITILALIILGSGCYGSSKIKRPDEAYIENTTVKIPEEAYSQF